MQSWSRPIGRRLKQFFLIIIFRNVDWTVFTFTNFYLSLWMIPVECTLLGHSKGWISDVLQSRETDHILIGCLHNKIPAIPGCVRNRFLIVGLPSDVPKKLFYFRMKWNFLFIALSWRISSSGVVQWADVNESDWVFPRRHCHHSDSVCTPESISARNAAVARPVELHARWLREQTTMRHHIQCGPTVPL